ncbi:RNA polymerase sigma factor [Tenacibaculum agarivorans]|uniref:RNA polymerase sigma factor n=1 Tax=Tenacibaculum agarivorans TaxID=1908389 RepID=UPI000A8E7716|nr:RNA polymerase sigma factor [Tenacibaculum agarivorans]
MSKEIDAELVSAFQSGDNKAFVSLVKRWHVSFCKLGYWYVKDVDLAKDIAQESWIIVYNKLQKLEDPKKFKNWAIRIVNRKAIDFLRFQKKIDKKNEEYKNTFQVTTEDSTSNNEVKNQLLKEIKKLSIEHQEVLQLFYVESYSLKEISTLLRISLGTVKSRLFYGRELLKKTMIKYKTNEKF